MGGEDFVGVTLANVDPSIVSCWDKMVKQGGECLLLLKHSKGKVWFGLVGLLWQVWFGSIGFVW